MQPGRSLSAPSPGVTKAPPAVHRGPVLAALVAGEAAEAFERQPAAASVERVMAVLRRHLRAAGHRSPGTGAGAYESGTLNKPLEHPQWCKAGMHGLAHPLISII